MTPDSTDELKATKAAAYTFLALFLFTLFLLILVALQFPSTKSERGVWKSADLSQKDTSTQRIGSAMRNVK